MNKVLVALFLSIIIHSCSRIDGEYTDGKLSGIYTEISPVEGRTQLAFIGGKKLVKASESYSHSKEYFYEITEGKIRITVGGKDPQPVELHFERKNKSTFEVGNFYNPSGNSQKYLIFRKIGMTQ